MRFKAILWDNDGTLIDTEPQFYEACKLALAEYGVELTKEYFIEVSLGRGNGVFDILEGKSNEEIAEIRDHRDDIYVAMLEREGVRKREDIVEVLEALKGKMRHCIVTMAPKLHFENAHKKTGLLDYFEFVINGDDVKRGKPSPEGYLKGLEKLGLDASECLVIEDTERGVMAAKAAGIECWAMPTELSATGDFSMADKVLSGPLEILKELA